MDEKEIHDILWEAAQELGGGWEESRRRMPKDNRRAQELLTKAMKSIEEGLASGEYEQDPETDKLLSQMGELNDYFEYNSDESYFQNN